MTAIDHTPKAAGERVHRPTPGPVPAPMPGRLAPDRDANGVAIATSISPEPPASPAGSANRQGGEQRRELAEFLRARRARIGPSDVGLVPGTRRRTPGLRREEVAQLSGIGVTWYTWLEQGRPIRVSVQVLDAVARTLRLDRAEQEHLYRLAGVPAVPSDTTTGTVSPEVREIVAALDPLPASLTNGRYDLLATNEAYKDLFARWHTTPCHCRNVLWCCFVEPYLRHCYVNFEEEMSRVVATLRARFAQHLNEPAWTGFIHRLSTASPEFAAMWARHDVAVPAAHTKNFLHPTAGLLRLHATNLSVASLPEAWLTVYTPADEDTRLRLSSTRQR
jgi:transcriptional regulator with XRE-family HTH domain